MNLDLFSVENSENNHPIFVVYPNGMMHFRKIFNSSVGFYKYLKGSGYTKEDAHDTVSFLSDLHFHSQK
jgi:hypothetical protein